MVNTRCMHFSMPEDKLAYILEERHGILAVLTTAKRQLAKPLTGQANASSQLETQSYFDVNHVSKAGSWELLERQMPTGPQSWPAGAWQWWASRGCHAAPPRCKPACLLE